MGKSDTLSRKSDHGTGTRDNKDLTLLTPGLFAMRALEGLQVVGEEKDILKEICEGPMVVVGSKTIRWKG